MAQQQGGLGSILKYGLIAGGVYFAYRAISGAASTSATASSPAAGSLSLSDLVAAIKQAQTSPAPAGTTATTAAAPAVRAPLTLQELLTAAGKSATDTLNGHEWNYYRNQLRPPDLTGAELQSAIGDASQEMTGADFMAGLQKVGLSGLGLGAVHIPVPVQVRTPDGRLVVVWAARDLPGSGPSRVAVFPGRVPFRFGAPSLPAPNWERQG